MIFNQSCSIMEEWKGVLNNDEKKNINKIFNLKKKPISSSTPIDQNLDSEKGTMMRRRIF